MKLTILKNKLKDGLDVVERVSSRTSSLPILKNIFIKVEKNFLNLMTTDLEIGIKWWSLVKSETEGGITVPATIFSSFIGLLPEKQVEMSIANQILNIKCDNYETQINGQGAEEFPIFPEVAGENFIVINNPSFCHGISHVLDVASPSSTRPEISGVYLLFRGDLIKMTATDSFRLAEKTISLSSPLPADKSYSVIIPQKTAREIGGVLGGRSGDLKVFFGPNQIMFEFPMSETDHPLIQITSRLIEGEYPNYQEIIPKKYETHVVLEKNEFLNQIKAASLFSGRISEIKLKIDPSKKGVDILSQNLGAGEYKSFVSAKIRGEKKEVSFNHRFLSDGLVNIKSSEVVFEISGAKEETGDSGPGVLRPVGDPSYIYVVMPIKGS